MSPDRQKEVVIAVRAANERLKGRLSPHPAHPQGRNHHAHIWKVIKDHVGDWKELDDSDVPQLLELVEWLVENPF
jgi:hypothetical protein